jgi:hypothetical protein
VSTSSPKTSEAVICMACCRIIAIIAVFCKYQAIGISLVDVSQTEEDD